MGWRWRKSISLGGGVRTTVSKQGMGVSWGFRGLRIGKSPYGQYWISIGIPGTGLYFIKYLSRPKQGIPPQDNNSFPPDEGYKTIEQPSSLSSPKSKNQEILERIKKTKQ
jgi:hypothetical protein